MATDACMEYTGFTQTAPAVTAALTAIGKAVSDSGLDKSLTGLIEIRASQIDVCAFCVQYHLNAERKLGLVAVWCGADVFTAEERAALARTEAFTHVTQPSLPSMHGTESRWPAASLRRYHKMQRRCRAKCSSSRNFFRIRGALLLFFTANGAT